MTIDDVLGRIFSSSGNTKEQGDAFESATVYFLKNDPLWAERFSNVWLWSDAPTRTGHDIGIDVVARDAGDGTYWAIQCKCYQEDSQLSYKLLSTFFSTAAADGRYSHYMIIDTANSWSPHLRGIAEQYGTVRVDLDELRESALDWQPFLEGRDRAERTFLEPLDHQKEAIAAVRRGFETADRGKLIMACGTGKTLTALRLAEELCPTGAVLFLAPSITLVAQTLRAWANQAKLPMRPFVVCSDEKASRLEDPWETSVSDVPYPATTDAAALAEQIARRGNDDGLTVVFGTYQSIQVVIDAQAKGAPEFDLCVCDEAHRTTGVTDESLSPEERSAFTKVHDADALRARKRLYMTATPRVYGTAAKRQAHENSFEVSSMDDEEKYGKELYRLSFGRAVELGLLSDYRVLVLTVSEDMASRVYQQSMEGEGGFDVPEAAKILGCWKGLATRGEHLDDLNVFRIDLDGDGDLETVTTLGVEPMKRAVAFCSTIADSQRMADSFQEVVDLYIEKTGTAYPLRVEAQHVDGGMNSVMRKGKLHWLEENPGADVCRVLTNAKCLSEGVDVPDLDAVLFMRPRKSQVEIIQAVGRVMRRAQDKKYGYVILPVVVPAGTSPEQALDDDKAFEVVWQVLQALRSHDERLDARINALKLDGAEGKPGTEHIRVDPVDDPGDAGDPVQGKLELDWTVDDWNRAMEARLVRRCGTRVYWDDWAEDVAGIAQRHIERIGRIVDGDPDAAAEFDRFLRGLRDSLNPGITRESAIEMLAQHVITLPVFEALFGEADFARSNPVSVAMQGMLARLYEHQIATPGEDATLADLYASVRSRCSVVQSASGRQALIKDLYENFFSKAFKGTSEKMGIVYTPNEIVDYILHATDRMLRQEFGEGLGSPGVHVLDPFAGTGTFTANLIESDLISDEELPRKYAEELHSNEILLLAYYIMTVNIEQAYHARMGGEYRPFEGAVLTDTFQMTEEGDTLDEEVFTQNSGRVVAENKLPIRVIVGNPPYSVGQTSANDNNANESYPTLDAKIAATYAARTGATNKNSLYDSYIRAFRWASDRIGDRGIICFVTNAGWVDGQAMDGMRKCLVEEFSTIHVFHLRGNQRTQGEESRKEGGKVFGSGSRAPIAITMLVKNPESRDHGRVFFHDVGDYLTREEKLAIVKRAAEGGTLQWAELRPDAHGDWLNQRDDSFYRFAPMGLQKRKAPLGMFEIWSCGLKTQRDPWAWSYSRRSVSKEMGRLIDNYNDEMNRYQKDGGSVPPSAFLAFDATKYSWTRRLVDDAAKGKEITFDDGHCVLGQYRPFCKQWVYYDSELNEMTYQQPRLFPLVEDERAKGPTSNPMLPSKSVPSTTKEPEGKGGVEMTYQQHSSLLPNLVIGCTNGSRPLPLVSSTVPDLHFVGDSQCFPLYWYERQEPLGTLFEGMETGDEYVRHDAITDETLRVFQKAYPHAFPTRYKKDGGTELSKEDVFYYVYGILHSPEYRERFDSNLRKELPRIPLAEDFAAFSVAGRALAHLHLDYETIEPWPLDEDGDRTDPGRTEKMRFGRCKRDDEHPRGEDMTVLHVAERMTLRNVPIGAYGYVINGKSAIGWLMDRYQVRTDKDSGIVNDPNEYSDDPRYIVDLVERVVRVSMETLEIVHNLPPLNEREQPADWPKAWKVM